MKALRQMPPVHDIIDRWEISDLGPIVRQPFALRLLEEVMTGMRDRLRHQEDEVTREALAAEIAAQWRVRVEEHLRPSLRRVVNATGVVLHTNLGRAPLPDAAIAHIREVSVGYSNLEFDLDSGRRGKRDVHVARVLADLLGSESAIIVNNNAAAVLLVLNALAEGGEVLVSRGEEIEIGGSFRIPEVMAKSGAILREVGTTNRTRIADYESAIGDATRMMLRVHPSNFKLVGFTERPSLSEFADLGTRSGVPTFEDLGSGCVANLGFAGIDEPGPAESIAAGIDLVSFSGDKLLGGPQAGIIAGRRDLVDRVRSNPLFRALRVDKLTLAALEAVLDLHLRGDLDGIPVWAMLRAAASELQDRAEALVRRIGRDEVRSAPMESVIGGGSVPESTIRSWGLAIVSNAVSAKVIEQRLRASEPPVIVRIDDAQVLVDLRTVRRNEEDILFRTVSAAIGGD
jgi:L-seryl-tRNA(Ser) seleniumtransferase